jgi:2-polyprenyl-3-methyl-5-hydroxy-6-metoxy-1,4-benzoquinol methylase
MEHIMGDVPVSKSTAWAQAPLESRYMPDQEPRGARREMLERVARGAEVLDVGCWSGAAGSFLQRERGAVVDGVEPESPMADRADDHYRTVYRSTIERAMEGLIAERRHSYDSLLFLDVLEHLMDPREILAASRELLRPGGRALISIPNVAHWSLRYQLLRGRWRYRDNGLLDRTHLRFFTRSTALELAQEAGWETTWTRASVDQPPLIRLSERRLRTLERWPTLFAVQFLVELRPSNPCNSV